MYISYGPPKIRFKVTRQTRKPLIRAVCLPLAAGLLLSIGLDLPAGMVNLYVGGNNLSSGSRDVHDTTVINDGLWHHVAVVIALGQTVSFYIDGVLKSTQPMATVSSGTMAPLYLGTLPGSYNGQPFVDALDDVWIFSSTLTSAQVAALVAGVS